MISLMLHNGNETILPNLNRVYFILFLEQTNNVSYSLLAHDHGYMKYKITIVSKHANISTLLSKHWISPDLQLIKSLCYITNEVMRDVRELPTIEALRLTTSTWHKCSN